MHHSAVSPIVEFFVPPSSPFRPLFEIGKSALTSISDKMAQDKLEEAEARLAETQAELIRADQNLKDINR